MDCHKDRVNVTASFGCGSVAVRTRGRLLTAVLAMGLCCAPSWAQGSRQFIQAELLKTIKAKKAKVGDPVKARAAQALVLPGGITISEGTILLGEVRAADASSLAVSFDQAELNGKKTPLTLSIRAAMMPGGPRLRYDGGSLPPDVSSSSRPRGGRELPGGPFDGRRPDAGDPKAQPVSTRDAQPGRNVAAETGSVIGMPGVTLQVDESLRHASRFVSASKELQLKGGLQLMLAVVE
jgi:hypothetical protein